MGLKDKVRKFLDSYDYQKGADHQVTPQNQLYQILYQWFGGGINLLDKDGNIREYVQEGYEGNADIFSIATKIATKFASIPGKLQEQTKGGKWENIVSHPFLVRMQKPNVYQTKFEFEMAWELFRLITGNSITYSPTLTLGNNTGRLTRDGMLMMPTQLVEIKAKNWKEPIGWYTFNIDSQAKQIDAADVWHERFPSLQYENGRHFMGLSPIKAAVQILNRQNSGYERAAKMYKQGIPPFLVTDPSLTGNPTKEQKKEFEKVWREKYGEHRNVNVPALTGEGVQVHQLGYNSVKDLAILDATQDGRRALCNIFQVAAELFNDSIGSTFNNRSEARKEMWTDRIMVDHRAYYDGINNNILPGYMENRILRYVPDYSDVEELQEDKKAKSGWVSRMYQDGVITGNKYRELMGEEPDENKHLETYYVNMNKIPSSQVFSSNVLDEENIREEGKAYERMGINY